MENFSGDAADVHTGVDRESIEIVVSSKVVLRTQRITVQDSYTDAGSPLDPPILDPANGLT